MLAPLGPALAAGSAGLALPFAELAAVRGDERAARAARAHMDHAIAAMATGAMSPWLFDGFSGIAWAAHHLFGEGSAQIDRAIAQVVRHAAASHEFYRGRAGLGIYALARPRAGLAALVGGLARSGVRDADGVTWETPVDSVPPGALPPGTRRHFNLGIAHGLPGVIGLLALACDPALEGRAPRRIRPARGEARRRPRTARTGARSYRALAAALLDGAVRWLLARRLPDAAPAAFPGWFDPDAAPQPFRQGWCYGDAAIARVLWLAARAADEPAWRTVALDVARRAAARPMPATRASEVDAGLCHGAAGLAHIFNRHWQATGERVFAEASRRWLDRALARLDQVSNDGLLSGRAGVALAALHATSAREPTWDRVLLLS